jgi:hypothetical protein
MNKQVAYSAVAGIALLLTIFTLYKLFDSKSEEQLALEKARQEIELSGDPVADSIALLTRKSLDSQINKLTMKKSYRDLIAQRTARRRVNDSIQEASPDYFPQANSESNEMIDSNAKEPTNNVSATPEISQVKDAGLVSASETPAAAPRVEEKTIDPNLAQIEILENEIQDLNAEGRLNKVLKLHTIYLKMKDFEKARKLINANIKVYKQKRDKDAVRQLEDLIL